MIKSIYQFQSSIKEDKHIIILPSFSVGKIDILLATNYRKIEIQAKEGAKWTLNFQFEQVINLTFDIHLIIESESNIKQNIIILPQDSFSSFNQIVDINKGDYQGILLDLSNGKSIIHNQINLLTEGSNSYFRCAVTANSEDHKVIKITTNNLMPYTTSLMDNYGVVKNNGTLLFEGVGKINKGSHHATNRQNSRIIIFDEESQANINPLLLIDEYDVIASHSAAVGRINEEHLYYLCSRGLTIPQAREYITLGYLNPVVDYFEDETKTKAREALQRSVV